MTVTADPFYLEDLMAEPSRPSDSMEAWTTAQKYEASYWVWYTKIRYGYTTRIQLYEEQTKHIFSDHLKMLCLSDTYTITGKVLDVGCGVLSVLEGLPNINIVAIDPNLSNYCEQLPEFAILGQVDNCFYRSCHIQDIASAQFNVVYAINVLGHTIDWAEMISHMHRVLMPGGMLLLGVGVVNKPPSKRRRVCHPATIQAEELLARVTECGFDIGWHTPLTTEPHRYKVAIRATRN